MISDVQQLQNAVLRLGDAALEIAEALSQFKDWAQAVERGLQSSEFEKPGDPKPPPSGTNIKSGEPLTPERFHKLMHADEPTIAGTGAGIRGRTPDLIGSDREPARSYATGELLSQSRSDARTKAAKRAAGAGYDFEAWS